MQWQWVLLLPAREAETAKETAETHLAKVDSVKAELSAVLLGMCYVALPQLHTTIHSALPRPTIDYCGVHYCTIEVRVGGKCHK